MGGGLLDLVDDMPPSIWWDRAWIFTSESGNAIAGQAAESLDPPLRYFGSDYRIVKPGQSEVVLPVPGTRVDARGRQPARVKPSGP